MIGLQGHMSVWAFPWVQYYIIESPFKPNSVKMNEFPNQPLKRISNDFDKISLLFQFALESEARSLLPTAQLDFRWTLDMSDQQTDWFATTSDSLSNSFSTMYTGWELFHRKFFADQEVFKSGIVSIVKNFIVI